MLQHRDYYYNNFADIGIEATEKLTNSSDHNSLCSEDSNEGHRL